MRPRQKKEIGRGRGWGGVLMLNKLSVLFVSLRPSQAFFFFLEIESVHDGYFLGSQKNAITVFAQNG